MKIEFETLRWLLVDEVPDFNLLDLEECKAVTEPVLTKYGWTWEEYEQAATETYWREIEEIAKLYQESAKQPAPNEGHSYVILRDGVCMGPYPE